MNGQPRNSQLINNRSIFKAGKGDYFFLFIAINKPMTVNAIIRISYALIGYLLHQHQEESGSNTSRYPSKIRRG